jgi:8-oxo-dGTP pyrophosphatase MutT (NUDIX family)
MAPAGRISGDYDPDPPGARVSAVLLLITPALELVYIRRAQDGGRHSGQIAFPGGAREDHDRDLVATALRETEEEIGVARGSVTVLGKLTPLYIPVTNFTIQPVVGILAEVPEFVCQPGEADEVILLPIAGFKTSLGDFAYTREGRVLQAPCYRFGEVEVWGATAMITAEFLAAWDEAVDGGRP